MLSTSLRSTVKKILDWAYPFIARPPVKAATLRALHLYSRVQGRLRRRKVIVYYYEMQFERKAHALADLFRRRGFDTRLVAGLSYASRVRLKSSPDLWIGYWNFVPNSLLPEHYIVINGEPLMVGDERYNTGRVVQLMNDALQVWDYSANNAKRINKLSVPIHYVPFGYAPYYEEVFQRHTNGKALPQDIDVLFYGVLSDRRRRVVDELREGGMKVSVLDRNNTAYGERLDELLARTKIILGIHYYDDPQGQIADFARLDHLLSNGLFVVHERPSAHAHAQDAAFVENVVTCAINQIPETCAYFLANNQERHRRANSAREWFKSEYPIDAFVPYDEVRTLLETKNR